MNPNDHLLGGEREPGVPHPSGNYEDRLEESTRERRPSSTDAVPLDPSLDSTNHDRPTANEAESNARDKPLLNESVRLVPITESPRPSSFGVWYQELLLSLYTVGLFIAITTVLSRFNKQQQPNWMLGLNLNTLIAILATFLRSALVTIVEQVIGQAKWTWQERPRPLSDLARFEEASRGPWGSFMLWFKVAIRDTKFFTSRHTIAAIVATIVTILSLAIGSFTQQSVKTVACTVAIPGGSASLPVGDPISTDLIFRYGAGVFDLKASAKARVFNALSGASYDRSTLIRGCPTGNCTFPEQPLGQTLSTAGICSKCTNATSIVKEVIVNGTSVLRLPNGLQVQPPSSVINVTSYSATSDWIQSSMEVSPDVLDAWNVSVFALDVLSVTSAGCKYISPTGRRWDCSHPPFLFTQASATSGDWNVVSTKCVLYPCIQDIKARIVNGRMEETVINETAFDRFNKFNGYAVETFRFPCFIDGIRYDKHNISLAPGTDDQNAGNGTANNIPWQCGYQVPFTLQRSIESSSNWLRTLLNGTCYMASTGSDSREGRSWPLCDQRWWLSQLYNGGNATFESISGVINGIATAITDTYRLDSISRGLNSNNTVNGTVWETTVCTEFNWPWLIFPASMVLLTILSLTLMMASTASSTNRPPVWKTSILPLLYLRDTPAEAAPEGYRINELEKTAKSERVKIEQDGTLRWRFARRDGNWEA